SALYPTVNMARHLGTKAELALQKANDKFERRFREVERIVAARGLEMTVAKSKSPISSSSLA
ncbi:hypothetical protein GFK32_23110, partial [Salmonella enterica subsp. enterica serovar Enteritidis]|nr:hypothetical protein [Salmonella enterica subsp. enterica serovar Enteritidis]